MITEKESGYLVDCYDTEQMANKIIEYFSDEETMTKMKKAALEKSKQYTEEVVSKKWKELIRQVLEEKKDNAISSTITKEELLDSFQNTYKNVQFDIDMIEGQMNKKEGFVKKLYRKTLGKVVYQYKTYGLKKTIKEIVYYPIKMIKRIMKK